MTETLLSLEGLTKAYPGVVANDDVSFSIAPGEVHALLGENGAGKSTLVKMIYGLVKPDQAGCIWNGAPYAPADPACGAGGRRRDGVSAFLAVRCAERGRKHRPRHGKPAPDARSCQQRIREVSETYGLPLDPTAWSAICPQENASGSRSSAACCRTPNC